MPRYFYFIRRILFVAFLVNTFHGGHEMVAFHASIPTYKKFLDSGQRASLIKGISIVAPPDEIKENTFTEVKGLGANWVGVVPYAFAEKNDTKLKYNTPFQWWGERPEGITKTIQLAHSNGLKVMLKPHVYIPGGWVGHLSFDTADQWEEWEAGYEKYILEMAEIAQREGVELFCFSTEFKQSTIDRKAFWYRLIKKIRRIYDGPLTFSANWDFYEEIPFWKELDVIGVSTYFPLSQSKWPSKLELLKSWEPIAVQLQAMSERYGKPILFTEYGYLSVEYTAKGHWILEPDIERYTVDFHAQAVALDALYQMFWNKSWWAGGFLWKWYPNNLQYTGFPAAKDYTPQDKDAIQIIKKWFQYAGD